MKRPGEYDDDRSRGPPPQKRQSHSHSTIVLLKSSEFAKVIGKKGANVTNMRQKTGAYIKGVELDAEDRMITIQGSYSQITEAFDDMVDVLYGSYMDYVQKTESYGDKPMPFAVYVLVEHEKAGRIIGSRGATITDLQARTSCHMKMSKEPKEMLGQQLRVLVLEGSHRNIRHAHACVTELFLQPQNDAPPPYANSGGSSHGRSPSGPSTSEGFGLSSQTLLGMGVPMDSVSKVMDAVACLVPYGIDLVGVPLHHGDAGGVSGSAPPYADSGAPAPSVASGGLYDPFASSFNSGLYPNESVPEGPIYNLDSEQYDENPETKEKRLEFFIVREDAGAVIGKGGTVMRETEAKFDMRIFLERDEVNGMRRIVIRAGPAHQKSDVMRCKEYIIDLAARNRKNGPGSAPP